jgi:hypothetical protein
MASERKQIFHITATDNGQPCAVDHVHVRERIVPGMEQAGWELVSCEPADESLLVIEVNLTFKRNGN